MGLLFGSPGERRAWTDTPPIPPNSERGRYGSRGVSLSATESNLQKVAVYAAVRLLRDVVEMLPLHFYTEPRGGEKREIDPPAWLQDPDGAGYGLPDFLSQIVYSDAMRGNVAAHVLGKDRFGLPTGLALIHPDDITCRPGADGRPEWWVKGKRQTGDIWHRRSFAIPGATWGLSPISAHALTVGLGISAEQFGAQFFMDGGHPTAIFQNTKSVVDPDKALTIKSRIMSVLAGNREPLVLGADWDYKPIQVTPQDSMFLATNNYTSSECARIFGPGMPAVLGYEVGGNLTYANVEQFNQQLLKFTFNPWLRRLERMVYDLLPRPQYARFNRGALLETDLLTRYRAHAIALQNRFKVVDEVRELEDMPPVPWGAEPFTGQAAPADGPPQQNPANHPAEA